MIKMSKILSEKILDKVKEPQSLPVCLISFNEAALGGYGKRTEKRQLRELIKEILADGVNRFNGSLRSAAFHYFNGLSLLRLRKNLKKQKKNGGKWECYAMAVSRAV